MTFWIVLLLACSVGAPLLGCLVAGAGERKDAPRLPLDRIVDGPHRRRRLP